MSEPSSDLAPSGRYSSRYLFLAAVAFIVAAPLFWQRTQTRPEAVAAAYENADLYQVIYPTFYYGFGHLRAGEMPLWNPKQLCGTPFMANPQSGIFQPLNMVFLGLSTEQAMALHSFVCLALMGWFFILFARSMDVGYVAAIIGGTAYAFCGSSAAAISRPALANAMAWTPLLFWGLREGLPGPGVGRMVPAGIAAGMLLLSGANAPSVIVLIVALLYGLFATVREDGAHEDGGFRRGLGKLFLMLALALLLAAVQWAPALAWAVHLDRPFETLFALRIPGDAPTSLQELLAQILSPKSGPLPRLGYVGALALLGVPAALVHHRSQRDAVFFLLVAATLLFLSVTGSAEIPLAFPYTCAVFPGMFCVAALVALGFDRLLVSSREPHKPHVGLPALLVVPAAVLLFYATTSEPRGRIIVFALLMLPVLLFRVRWLSMICGAVLAAVLFADLATASVNLYRHPFEDAPGCYQRYTKTINAAEDQALGSRVLVSAPALDFGLPSNLAMIVPTLHDVNGQAPLTRDQIVWWRRLAPVSTARMDFQGTQVLPEAPAPDLLNFMCARAILAAPESPLYAGTWQSHGPTLREVKTEDAVRLFVNDRAMPRLSWKPSWRMVEGIAAAADTLVSPDFDGTRECVIDRDSNGYAQLIEDVGEPRNPAAGPAPEIAPDAECSFIEDSPERVVVHVNAPQPGVTLLADSFDSGWKARLDGKRCPILRANGIFRGVATPAGKHEIVFTYRPLSFLTGAVLSFGALALLSLLGIIAFFRG